MSEREEQLYKLLKDMVNDCYFHERIELLTLLSHMHTSTNILKRLQNVEEINANV